MGNGLDLFIVAKERAGSQTKLVKICFYWYALELCSDYLLCKIEVELFQDDYLIDQLCMSDIQTLPLLENISTKNIELAVCA